MNELIEYLLKMLVDFPDKLKINRIDQDNMTILEITADPSDIGKIIGKQGRVIKAIRAITNAATIKERNRTIIEIMESKNSNFPINY
ncbi:MAG: KH domain-containing protein [Atribacterota bacterium]|nr:KH domain-containing protein [Atribacterota bacterium]MDD4896176.1 KH domain-containing protein [Atribacterota bacterium]MDD5637665.1 KH domain-containing protein [Atribacterota bacterium]